MTPRTAAAPTAVATPTTGATVPAFQRIVVKAGTQVLLSENGYPSLARIFALVETLAELRRAGKDVLLVSSGAVGLGARRLGLAAKPGTLVLQQACAAVGQGELMALYQSAFGRLDTVCAQVLLTQEDFSDPERRGNLRATLGKLLKMGVIPIINENDTVATMELGRVKAFGDNDKLSALVAAGLGADLLLILSDVDGLHEANPHAHPRAALLQEVAAITPEILALAEGGSARGRGGMATKLESARLCMGAGVAVVIASGERPGVIQRVVAGAPEGTRFQPGPRPPGDSLEPWLKEMGS